MKLSYREHRAEKPLCMRQWDAVSTRISATQNIFRSHVHGSPKGDTPCKGAMSPLVRHQSYRRHGYHCTASRVRARGALLASRIRWLAQTAWTTPRNQSARLFRTSWRLTTAHRPFDGNFNKNFQRALQRLSKAGSTECK